MLSFQELSKAHQRKQKFLKLRLETPNELYDVQDIRNKLRPMQAKIREE